MEAPLNGHYVELLRQSTSLFNASHSLAWSRVFVAWPTAPKDLFLFLSSQSKGQGIEVPMGPSPYSCRGHAVDDQGRPKPPHWPSMFGSNGWRIALHVGGEPDHDS